MRYLRSLFARSSLMRLPWLPLLFGAIYPLGFAPVDLKLCVPVSLFALLWLTRAQTMRQALWTAWAWGFAAFGIGLSWVHVAIHDFGDAPLPLSLTLTLGGSAIMGLFIVALMWPLKRFFDSPLARALAFAPLLLVSEYIRAYVLTGFPWLYAGYSQTDSLLARLAPIGSVYLVGLVLALLVGLCYWCCEQALSRWGKRGLLGALSAAALMMQILMMTPAYWPEVVPDPAIKPIRAALVQANIAQQIRWQPEQLQNIARQYRDLSLPIFANNDLVIWPEGSIPILQTYLREYFEELSQIAKAHDSGLIAGVFSEDANGHIYNAAVGFAGAEGNYAKQHLVPFGEYVPFQQWLRGLLSFFDLPMSGLAAGSPTRALHFRGHPVLTAICYETTYPELVRDTMRAQTNLPQWMLTVSNDGWYGDSWGPKQHLQIVRMRAQELGLPILRVTPTGITVAIDANGQILAQLPSYQQGVLQTTIQPRHSETLWLRYGMSVVVIFAILLLGFAAAIQRLKTRPQYP